MPETNVSDWDHLPTGEIETSPLAGWEVAAAPGLVLLRLEIVVGPGQIGTAQFRIPSAEAADLARSLSHFSLQAIPTGSRKPARRRAPPQPKR